MVDDAVEPEDLAQRKAYAVAPRWLPKECADHEVPEDLDLLDHLTGRQAPLGRHRAEELTSSHPERLELLAEAE